MEEKIKNVFQVAKEHLRDNYGLDEASIKLESDLISDLGLDSLGLLDFYWFLQEHFEVDPEDSDFNKAKTIREACEVFAKLI